MQQKGLKPATKVVLYWLADHHNSETGLCFPSLSILAEECDLDRSTVIRHIVTLERCGLLMRVHRKRKNGSTTSNGYQLFLEKQPVGKYNPPSRKMPPPPVVNCDPHNLGSNNLGNITNNISVIFDDLWSIYPKKVGKGQARKAFNAALRKVDYDKIHAALIDYVKASTGKDKKYLPHLSTWLNGERWDDELQEQSLQDMTSEQQMQAILGSSEPSISQSLLAKYDRSKQPSAERLHKMAEQLGMSIEQSNGGYIFHPNDRKRIQ